MGKFVNMLVAGAAVALTMGAPAMAQDRDPAYAAARAAGQVGELPTGFLGTVGPVPAAVSRMVDDLNIKRRAVYADHAKAQGATMETYAFTMGCSLIAKTVPGEKYMGTDGQWHTRTNEAPQRDGRCPA